MFRSVIIILTLSIISFWLIGYGIYKTTHGNVIQQVIFAFEDNDFETLEERVSWAALRSSLVREIREKELVQGDEVLKDSSLNVNDLVSYYIQPENIDVLFYLKERHFPSSKYEDFVRDIGYAPLLGFYIELGAPKPKTHLTSYKDFLNMRLYFSLEGLTYKISALDIPKALIPQKIYDEPLLDYIVK